MMDEKITIKEYFRITRSIFIIGTILRFIFAPFTGHPFDLPIWLESGQLISYGISPYSPRLHLGQTILWALWTGISYTISFQFYHDDPYLYIFLIKLLPILADIGVCYLTIQILQEKVNSLDDKKVKLYTMLIYFNPVFFIASSFWGMVDSLALFLILLAFKTIRNSNHYRSATFLTIAIALKLFPVILLPSFLLYIIIYQGNFKQSIFFGIYVLLLFFFIAYIPFLIFTWGSDEITGVLISQSNRDFGGMSVLGFFRVSNGGKLEVNISLIQGTLLGLEFFRLIWIVSLSILAIFILLIHYKSSYTLIEDDFQGFLYLLLSFYSIWILFAPWVSEQNFVPLMGFLYLLLFYYREIGISTSKISNILFAMISLVTAYIMINVPIIMFFYLKNPNFFLVYGNSTFMIFRSTYLSILIIASTLNLIYFVVILFRRMIIAPTTDNKVT